MVDGFSDNDRVKMAESSEKHEFQAEVNRLMDIIINSLYTEAREATRRNMRKVQVFHQSKGYAVYSTYYSMIRCYSDVP